MLHHILELNNLALFQQLEENMKLAEALLLRKELQAKVDRLKAIDQKAIFETRTAAVLAKMDLMTGK